MKEKMKDFIKNNFNLEVLEDKEIVILKKDSNVKVFVDIENMLFFLDGCEPTKSSFIDFCIKNELGYEKYLI